MEAKSTNNPAALVAAVLSVVGALALLAYERSKAPSRPDPVVQEVSARYLASVMPPDLKSIYIGPDALKSTYTECTANLVPGAAERWPNHIPATWPSGHYGKVTARYLRSGATYVDAELIMGKWHINDITLTQSDSPERLKEAVSACLRHLEEERQYEVERRAKETSSSKANQAAWASEAR